MTTTDVDDTETDPDDDDEELGWWGTAITWPRLVALVVVAAFFGGAVTYAATRPMQLSASSVDVGFYQDMSFHHEQAVQMALIEQQNGSDEIVESYATEIIRQQSIELGEMIDTLQRYGYSSNAPDTVMAWMHTPVPRAQMPGLATDAQIEQLREAKGLAADRLFLQLMTAHHLGGIHMATYAYFEAKLSSVRLLAQKMAYAQAEEINEFRQTAHQRNLGITIAAATPTVPDPTA